MNLPVACPQSGQTLDPLIIQHPNPPTQLAVSGINASAINQIVASPVSNLAFLTYTGSTPAAKLPYYITGSNGAAGTLNYVTLTGGNTVTAPIAGAFTLDNKLFFVSTAGDDLIHFINTSTLQGHQADQSRPSGMHSWIGSGLHLQHHSSPSIRHRSHNRDCREAARINLNSQATIF